MKRVLVLVLLFGIYLYANVAKITALSGEVDIKRGNSNIKGAINLKLEKNDIIFTKDNSRVQIVFKDNTLISLGKNSKLDIQDYLFEDAKNSKIKLSITRGIFKFIDGKIGKLNPKKFILKTKNATIGVRGTIGIGVIPPNGEEQIACTSGSISVATKAGEVVVPAGMMTVVKRPDTPPTHPVAIPKSFIKKVDKSTTTKTNQTEASKNNTKKKKESYKKSTQEKETVSKNTKSKQTTKASNQKNDTVKTDTNKQDTTAENDNQSKNETAQENPTNENQTEQTATTDADTETQPIQENTIETNVINTDTTAITDNENNLAVEETVEDQVSQSSSSDITEYYAIHSTWLSQYPLAITDNDFYELSSNKNFYMENGILKGSDILTKTIINSGSYSNGGSRTFSFNDIDLQDYPTHTNYQAFIKVADVSKNIVVDSTSYTLHGGVFADDKLEFFLYEGYVEDNDNEPYNEVLFFGKRSRYDSLPNDGISWYGSANIYASTGSINPFEQNGDPYLLPGDGTLINWKNKNMLSYDLWDNNVFILIGTVGQDSNGYATVNVKYRENYYDFSKKVISVSTEDGYIFGSEYQGWGGTIKVEDTLNNNTTYLSHGEFRKADNQLENLTTLTGSTNFYGFANFTTADGFGAGNLAIAMSRTSSITGSIDLDSGYAINFGGNLGEDSSYITDDIFATLNFSGSIFGSDTVQDGWLIGIDSGSLYEDGSDDGISWGFWGLNDSDNSNDTPIASWVAGINPLDGITSAQTGTYEGTILGFLDDGSFIDPKNSSISMTFDFGTINTLANLSINANGITKNYTGLNLLMIDTDSSGYSDTYSYDSGNGEEIIGKFYGPDGKITAGSFSLDLQSGVSGNAHGVFKALLKQQTIGP